MARSYAQLHQRIWADPDWRALDLGAQHLYLLLISQPQLNMAGVLPLQLRKWSSCVDGWDIGDVAGALDRLRDRRFVIVDEDTEEVLVRTLIRNDGGYKTPGMLKSILQFAEAAQSPAIRLALAVELGRLDPLNGKTAEDGRGLIAATRAVLFTASGGPSGPGREPIPDGIGDGIPDGIGDTFVGTHPGYHPQSTANGIGDAMPDTSVTGTGTGARVSLVENLGGEELPPPPDEPPLCNRHRDWDRDDVPGCRGCGNRREKWQADVAAYERQQAAEAAKPKPMCRVHPGQVATHCGPCRSEQIGVA